MMIMVIGTGRIGVAVETLLRLRGHAFACFDTLSAAIHANFKPGHVDVVVACVPWHAVLEVARYAVKLHAHYIDFTESVATRKCIENLASHYPTFAFVSGCGVAPGLVNAIAGQLIRSVPNPVSVTMACGALPQDSQVNALGYRISWNLEGLVHQYTAAGVLERIDACQPQALWYPHWPALELLPTSGGEGTVAETYPDIQNCNYYSLRYPGHVRILKVLLGDCQLASRRSLLADVLRHACGELDFPREQDVVYVYVEVIGDTTQQYARMFYPANGLTAIQHVTATHGVNVLEQVLGQGLRGFIRPETLRAPA